jgi:RNA polymerase sigma-70 factor (ECF subfamily)
MEPTDGELLERWRGHDAASGEALFDRYYPMVERFFLNKVGDAVSDLVQETFIRCVENRDKIRDNNQFRLYIFGIAYNVLKAHLRVRYRGGQPVDVHESSVRDVAAGPVTLAVRRSEHRMLLEALRSIPIEDQVILELHYWDNLTTDDIAEALAIPAGTARGRLQRARDKLGDVMHRLTLSAQDLMTTVACLEGWARDCRDHLDSYRDDGRTPSSSPSPAPPAPLPPRSRG